MIHKLCRIDLATCLPSSMATVFDVTVGGAVKALTWSWCQLHGCGRAA